MATSEAEEEITGGRSSSASHYSSEFTTATVGTAENDFYGIPLSTDLTGADTNDLVGLGALLFAVVVVKPLLDRFLCGGNDEDDDDKEETKKKRSRGNDAGRGGGTAVSTSFSIVFWSAALVAAFRLKEVALYPLLSTVVFTRTSYPYLVLISHCLSSLCGYRTERETRDRKKGSGAGAGGDNLPHYLESFCFTFFCYGFGGSILSDLLMGIPVTAFGHPRIVPCYVLCYLLIYHSPLDLAYRALTGNTFLNYFVAAMEAVDGVTTPMGRVSRSARELSNKTVAPVVAGVFAGAGGASLRYAERVVLHDEGTGTGSISSRAALDDGLWRSLGISCVWWYLAVYGCSDDAVGVGVDVEKNHCSSSNGSDLVRVVAVGGHVVWTLASKSGLLGWTPFGVTHPLGWLIKDVLGGVCLFLARVLRLGPTAQRQPQADDKKKKKKKKKND